jgi:hypothetical protein
MFTEAQGHTRIIPLSSRIAPHDGKTHFVYKGDDGQVEVKEDEKEPPVVGVASYGFTPDIEWSPAALETQLDFFLRVGKSGIGYFETVWHGVRGKRGIGRGIW